MSKVYAGYCKICGKYFESSYKTVVTCSKICAYKLRGKGQQKRIKRKCATCGKDFEIVQAWLRKSGSRGFYCSRKCRWTNPIEYNIEQKRAANMAVFKAIKDGNLKKEPCYFCNKLAVQAHHYKGYDEENFLEIIWLCLTHHNRLHELLRKMGLTQYL